MRLLLNVLNSCKIKATSMRTYPINTNRLFLAMNEWIIETLNGCQALEFDRNGCSINMTRPYNDNFYV